MNNYAIITDYSNQFNCLNICKIIFIIRQQVDRKSVNSSVNNLNEFRSSGLETKLELFELVPAHFRAITSGYLYFKDIYMLLDWR